MMTGQSLRAQVDQEEEKRPMKTVHILRAALQK